MSLPNVNIHVQDGNLGLMSDFPSGIFAQVGIAGSGPINAPVVCTDMKQVDDTFKGGPLADAIMGALMSGARIIVGVRAQSSIPGSIDNLLRSSPGTSGPVTKQGTGNGNVTVDGSPSQSGTFEIQIVDGGDLGVATFQWRISGGDWTGPITTAPDVEIPELNIWTRWEDALTPAYDAGDLFTCDLYQQGTGQVNPGGSPTGDHTFEIEITAPGGLNQAMFKYRVDQGDWSADQTVQSQFDVPDTGVTLEFVEGSPAEYSFLQGDIVTFDTEGPSATVEDVMAAIDALLSVHYPLEFIHIVGETESAMWAALQAKAEEFADQYRFLHVLAEARGPAGDETVDEWVQALVDESSGFSGNRVSVCAGLVKLYDEEEGSLSKNGAPIYAGRLSMLGVQTSPGKVIQGPLPLATGLGPLDQDENSLINDGHIALLDSAGYITFRKYQGLSGVYVTNGRMMVDDTSDFRWVEFRRAMDKACREVRLAGLRSLHGEASQEGIAALKADIKQPLDVMLANREITGYRVVIPEDQDILATSTIRCKIAIQPVPTMRFIEVEIGLENPFRAAA